MNPHKLYLSLIAILIVCTVLVGSAWREHVRDDAKRDAVLETQKNDIAGLQQSVASAREQAQAQIADWERQRKQLVTMPARAPDVIRELVPMRTPIQETTTSGGASAPDAPSAVLSKQQEVDLANYALGCKECSLARDQLEQESKDQRQIIDRQKLEIDAAKKAAKGGSIWQRAVRIAKWGAVFGGIGYVMGRAQR
jgi:hypothetical protein